LQLSRWQHLHFIIGKSIAFENAQYCCLGLGSSKSFSLHLQIDDFMMQLYYMFRRSDKKWAGLVNVASAVEDHILKPSKSQGTRWIGHRQAALKALDRDYRVLRMLFEEMATGLRADVTGVASAEMKGHLKNFKTHKFLLYLGIYLDLTEELSTLSAKFQAEDVPITSVRSNIEVAVMSLRALLEAPTSGHHTQTEDH